MNITKKFGIVRYCGTVAPNQAHSVSFESNDIVEVQRELAERRAAAGTGAGLFRPIDFTIVVRGKGGIGDARLS